MNPRRKKRLTIILAISLGLVSVTGLVRRKSCVGGFTAAVECCQGWC